MSMGARRRDRIVSGFTGLAVALATLALVQGDEPAAAQLPSIPPVPELPTLPETPELPPVPAVPDVELPSTNETVETVRDTVNGATGATGGGGGSSTPPATTPSPEPQAPAADPDVGGTPAGAEGNDRGGGGEASPDSERSGGGDQAPDPGGNDAADAEGFSAAAPRAVTARVASRPAGDDDEDATLAGRFGDAIASLPSGVLIGLLGMGALALLMTGRSAWFARATEGLKRQRSELREDVDVLQSALVPSIPAEVAGAAVAVAFRPAGGPASGGDFHDAFDLGGGHVGFVVGDVSGHGPEALPSTAIIRYTIRAYLEAGLEPRAALRLADRALAGSIGGDFATAIAAVYDTGSDRLTYSAAGHPPPLVVGGHEHRPVVVMSAPPIGLGPASGSRQTTITVGPGASVWLFTDGLTEARAGDGLLGRDGLQRLLAADQGPAALLERIAAGAGTVADDMTACRLSPAAVRSDPIVIEEVEVGPGTEPSALREFAAACGAGEREAEAIVARATGADVAPRLLRLSRSGDRFEWKVTGDDGDGPGETAGPALGEPVRIRG